MIIYAHAPDDDVAVKSARQWIRDNGLTSDDARLVRKDGMILVIDKGTAFAKLKPRKES